MRLLLHTKPAKQALFRSSWVWGRGGVERAEWEYSEPEGGAGFEEGIHISALALLQGLQRNAPRGPHCLFLHFTRERQELNPHGFGCLGHRNATWVKCLLPAFQLEGSTPFLELSEPLICASASKTLVVANLVTWVVFVLLVSRA